MPISANDDQDPASHPNADLVAAYLERRLPRSSRASLEDHFALCAQCRAELVDLAPVIDRRRHVPLIVTSGVLAAAAALIFAVMPHGGREYTETAGRAEVRFTPEALDVVRAVSPAIGASVARPVRFVWRADTTSSYRVILTDSVGRRLWATSTEDTMAVLPSSVSLAPGARYHWYVDAVRPDGSSLTSGPQEFIAAGQ